MILFAVILFLGILLWCANIYFEWTIPAGCQTIIETWRQELSGRSRGICCVWDTWPAEEELERTFWHLKKDLSQLGRKIKVPFWIEIQISQSTDERQNNKYLSCLQRRFPELEVTMCSSPGEGSDT